MTRVDALHHARSSPAASPRRAASAPPASAPASRPSGGLDLALLVVRRAGAGGRGVHHQPRAGGAGARLARAPRALGRRRARDRRQQRLRQRLHRRRRACRTRATWRPKPRALVGCPVEQVLVASTGVIGVACRWTRSARRCRRRSRALGADQGAGGGARDHDDRSVSRRKRRRGSRIGGRDVTIGGMAKGSGMIEPMMATMLGFVTTDAAVPQPLLDRALREAVDDTFNAITVDGECSTNDCVMLLANGASGVDGRRGELRRVRRRAARGLPRAGARHRPRRRRRDQAGHRHRHRRGVDRARRARRPRRSPTRCS